MKVYTEDRSEDQLLGAARASTVAAGVAPPLTLSVAKGNFLRRRLLSVSAPKPHDGERGR